jgi:hypothetical protein
MLLSLLTAAAVGSAERPRYRRRSGALFGGKSAAEPPAVVGFDPASTVCLLTIMTQERTASLHRMLRVWDGYVSIALLVDVYDEAAPEGINLLRYKGVLPPAPQRVTLSIVEDRGYRSPYNRFPYNVLRNVALEGCSAPYVLAADVDFVPYSSVLSLGPSAILRQALHELDVRAAAHICALRHRAVSSGRAVALTARTLRAG